MLTVGRSERTNSFRIVLFNIEFVPTFIQECEYGESVMVTEMMLYHFVDVLYIDAA